MKMNELTVFTNARFGTMRTVTIDGEPWFVGKDVAEILGYERPSKAIVDRVDEEDRRMVGSETQSQIGIELGQRGGWLINESGLYSLILSSKLPCAKEFKRWVTSEILPSIRRHGVYATEELLNNPDLFIQVLLQLKEEKEKTARLQPKADYYDAVCESGTLTSFRETAKLFGIPEKGFIRWLEGNRYCYRDAKNRLVPFADKLKRGLFEVKEVLYGGDAQKTTVYTKVTPKGRTVLFEKMKGERA